MITNNKITYYHKELDKDKTATYTKYNFYGVWVFSGKGTNINDGYENSNSIIVRIPMELVEDEGIFDIGDIIAIGEQANIEKQSDLNGKQFFNVTSIRVNSFGRNSHIHLEGR